MDRAASALQSPRPRLRPARVGRTNNASGTTTVDPPLEIRRGSLESSLPLLSLSTSMGSTSSVRKCSRNLVRLRSEVLEGSGEAAQSQQHLTLLRCRCSNP